MRSWEADQPDTALVIRRVDDPELALRTGKIDVAFFRSTPGAPTLQHSLLGHERRVAAVAVDDPLSSHQELTLGMLATRRPASIRGSNAARSLLAFFVERSIS